MLSVTKSFCVAFPLSDAFRSCAIFSPLPLFFSPPRHPLLRRTPPLLVLQEWAHSDSFTLPSFLISVVVSPFRAFREQPGTASFSFTFHSLGSSVFFFPLFKLLFLHSIFVTVGFHNTVCRAFSQFITLTCDFTLDVLWQQNSVYLFFSSTFPAIFFRVSPVYFRPQLTFHNPGLGQCR